VTDHSGGQHRSFVPQFIFATGYLALGFIAVTLLIGPANLLLRRRTPVSNYLSRDVGTWAAIGSVVHTIFVLLGTGGIRDFLAFFVAPGGSPLLNSFGLGNWTGLVALVIVVGLLAISSDVALRKLKAGIWKRLQRLNYALFALVILHAYFYGALLRLTSPFTLLLGVSVLVVFVGQAVGVWLWRRRHARSGDTIAWAGADGGK
jgi:sulfoxide reductase heme-binding subunit YedZ